MSVIETNQIICGDNMEVMAGWPDEVFDTIVTDPPYGLGFMGKEWDTFQPEVVTQQMKRDTRTQKRRQLYDGRESDAPSAAMAAGRYDFSRNAEFQQWFTIWAKGVLRIARPGATMLIFGGTRTFHRLACAIEDAGWQIRDCMMWLYGSGFPKSTNISLQFDKSACLEQLAEQLGRKPTKEELKKAWEGFRIKTGEIKTHAQKGVAIAEERTAVGGGAFGGNRTEVMTSPATDLAKLWSGWGTALKPAWEPIIVAMKPLDGTFAHNAEKHGVAGLNIDGGRVGTDEDCSRNPSEQKENTIDLLTVGKQWGGQGHPRGRWPANVILDEEAAAMLDEQSGEVGAYAPVKSGHNGKSKGIYGDFAQKGDDGASYRGRVSGASRFFYCAKASRAERNAGLEGMEEKQLDESRKPENPGGNNPRNRGARSDTNHHPTVKPLKLMEYLCTLTRTPTGGGVVLDCFGGSGTTAMGCVFTDRDYILIEKDAEYCEIARRRVKWAEQQKQAQMGLF